MYVKDLAKGLTYKGEAEGKRQTYYIYEGKGFFFIISFNKDFTSLGYFHFVEPEVVDYVHKNFAGATDVTAKAVFERAHRTRYFAGPLDALNILYILVGLGQATVNKRFKNKSLHFNIK